ncbi:MAG TPA: molybdopterin cofactor-binding domain-containing protein [Anaerolineae bacterium]|nr:molybdopterin cofactor-binding domain-containing protein [Anaerolineae bacterium]
MTQYVGQAMPRYDGIGQVTGRTQYVDDVVLPGMVYVKLLRSPVHKGTIRSLDLSPAESTPGVVGTLAAKDIPGKNVYGFSNDQPVFNEGHLRYKGEPIAAVVAVDEDTCMEALEKVKLDIEEQEPVFDMWEAMKPGAPIVRPGTTSNLHEFEEGMTTRVLKVGDVEKGFAEADYIVEDEFKHGMQDHGPIEPHASVAYLDVADRLTIHTVSQCRYVHMGPLCDILGLTQSQIRLVGGTVGGGFGGKNDIHADHIAGLAALKFRKPVKFRWTKREDLRYSTKRGPWVFKYKSGITKDGRIVARYIQEWQDSGGYGGLSAYVVEKCGMFAPGGYHIPNMQVDAQVVYTNKLIASSMRGFGISNGMTCVEIHMNRIAEDTGIDPWELRFINAWRDNDIGVTRYVVKGAGGLEAMKKAAELAGIQLPDHLMAMSSRRR